MELYLKYVDFVSLNYLFFLLLIFTVILILGFLHMWHEYSYYTDSPLYMLVVTVLLSIVFAFSFFYTKNQKENLGEQEITLAVHKLDEEIEHQYQILIKDIEYNSEDNKGLISFVDLTGKHCSLSSDTLWSILDE